MSRDTLATITVFILAVGITLASVLDTLQTSDIRDLQDRVTKLEHHLSQQGGA